MAFGKSKKTQLVIPPPNRQRAIVTVGGEFLVLHRFDEKSRRQIEEKQRGAAANKRGARDPEGEYNAARYVDAKGRDCLMAAAFRRAMIDAASFIENIAKTQIRGAVFIIGDSRAKDGRWLIPLKYTRRFMHEDVVRLSTGVADLRYRPAYENWSVDLTVEYDPDILSAEQIHHLLQRAGFSIGVGEGRAQKGGDWGAFELKNVARKRLGKPRTTKATRAVAEKAA